MLFYLLAAHALVDFAGQSDRMAASKSRRTAPPEPGAAPWYFWLTAHAVLHGAAVGLVVRLFGYEWYNVIGFALAETAAHWAIDFGKTERLYGVHLDQVLHILCKIAWWLLLVYVATWPPVAAPG
jgi:hypothetical protein